MMLGFSLSLTGEGAEHLDSHASSEQARAAELVRNIREGRGDGGAGQQASQLFYLGGPGLTAIADVLSDSNVPIEAAESISNTCDALRQGLMEVTLAPVAERLALVARDPERPRVARLAALSCIASAGPAAARSATALHRILDETDSDIRSWGLSTLAAIGDATIVPVLLRSLKSSDLLECWRAYDDLSTLGPAARAAVPTLLQLLKTDAWENRERAAFALGWIRDPAAVDGLIQALQQNSWRVNRRAAEALGRIGARKALPALRELQKAHWYDKVRRVAGKEADKIERQGTSTAPPRGPGAVESYAIVDVQEQVRALCQIRGQDFLKARGPAGMVRINAGHSESVPEELSARQLPEGNRSFLKVDDGWLVGVDNGEWGGGLYFYGAAGPPEELPSNTIFGLARTSAGPIAITDEGQWGRSRILRIQQGPGGKWTTTPLTELPGGVVGFTVAADGTLIIATGDCVVALSREGRLTMLPCA